MVKLTSALLEELGNLAPRAHWLNLPSQLQEILHSTPPENWAVLLANSSLQNSTERIAQEMQACIMTQSRVTALRNRSSRRTFPSPIREFVVYCAYSAGVGATAKYFKMQVPLVCYWKTQVKPTSAEETVRIFSQTEGAKIIPKPPKIRTETKIIPPHVADDSGFSKLEEAFRRFAGKTRRRYSRSEKRQILALADEFGSTEVHKKLGVSYDTIARLLRRSKRRSPEEVSEVPARYSVILEVMKQHPGMGPMQIRDWLARHNGLRMGVNTVREVMERAGWVPPLVRKKEFLPGQFRRYEAVRRNVMWHGDFLHSFINTCKVYILFIQDDHSRFITGFVVIDGEKADGVINMMQKTIETHGKPECFMADRGSAFRSWRGIGRLTRYLEELGIDQHVAEEPRINGKIENLNQQVQKELLNVRRFTSLAEFETGLADWVEHFNFRRCHQGLGKLQVPADRYFPGAEKAYTKASEKNRSESEMLRALQDLIAATRTQPETVPPAN